ncbi:MAG: hypothetical protein IH851_07005 [Armatimonadetes bacterium]|nr:hypothetical protein [Armatimonadota bacterium]
MKISLFRLTAVLVSIVFAVQTSSLGVHALLESVSRVVHRLQLGTAPMFTERPGRVFQGANPNRDPVYRAGMWSPKLRADLARFNAASRGIGVGIGVLQAPPGGGGGDEGSGGGGPGEGGGGGGGPSAGGNEGVVGSGSGAGGGPGGATVNTNTGNRLASIALTGWPVRGGMSVGFTLYHNSLSTYDAEFGYGWSWTYDVNVSYTQGSSAIIRWSDGLTVPYTEDPPGTFTPPPGFHGDLVKNPNGSWTFTTPGQTALDFNSTGVLHTVQDRNGNAITLTLDGNNRATAVTGPSGRQLTIAYDGNNRVSSITDPSGRVWSFTHDANGDLTQIDYPLIDGQTYSYTLAYNANHNITSHTDRRGNAWTMTYDSGDRLTSWTDPLNSTTSYTYNQTNTVITFPEGQQVTHNYSNGMLASIVDAAGFSDAYQWNSDKNLTQYTDRRSKVWSFTFDTEGNLLTGTNPLSNTVTLTYNSTNDLLTVEDPLTHEWSFAYDPNGNLLTVTDPLLRTVVTSTYDGYGQLTSVENALFHAVDLAYNSNGDVTTITDPLLNATALAYDVLSRLTSAADPLTNAYTLDYDAWGRVKRLTHPDTNFIEFFYDPQSLVSGVTDELGRSSSMAYDAALRATQGTNAKNESHTFAYDGNGRLTGVTNARGFTRSYTYTPRGEVYTLTLPDGAVETWSYDANGALSAYTNPLTQTINYVYDDAGQLTTVDYPTGVDSAFTYDDDGRLTQMVDSTGTTTWTYNDADELTTLNTPQGSTTYTYDDAGRPATMVETGVGTTVYGLDAAARLVSLTNPFGELTDFVYDEASRLIRKDLANGTYEEYAYDNRSRVTSLDLKDSLNQVISSHAYGFDAVSNVLTRTDDAVTTTFAYDAINQLLSESRAGYLAEYAYDANGNRLSKTLNGNPELYTYDSADKLLSAGAKTYTHDLAGRTTGITNGPDTTTFTWDYEDRLTGITYPSASTNSFTYNGIGARTSKSDSTGSYTFHRNGTSVIAPVLSDGVANYTPGLSERRGGASTFYHGDIKNGVTQTSSTQTVSASKSYDAFGNLVSQSGTWTGPFSYGGQFGYQSDPDSGYMHLGHRYYDPSTGRFLTRDGARDGRNWYTYAGNNPITRADPAGLFWEYVLDAIGLGWDVKEFINEPSWANAGWIGLDIVLGILPVIPNTAVFRLGAKYSDDAADAAKRAKQLANNKKRGDAFESTLEGAKNTRHIRGSGINTYRIPDRLDDGSKVLREAKNVQYLSKTRQLEDMLKWTENNGFKFYLHVPEGTRLTGPLQKLIDQDRIILARQAGLF